jgi:hypothetical protein
VFQNTETFDYLIDDKVESMTFEEMYPAYTTPQQLNASISQRITDGVTDDVWVEGTLHYIDQNGNINDMDVDAAMNDVDDNCTDTNMCESGVSDADIHLKMSCDEVKANYTFDVYSMSGTPFSWEVQYFDSAENNTCSVDFTSTTPITGGIRTLYGEVKEEQRGKFTDILFSFAR